MQIPWQVHIHVATNSYCKPILLHFFRPSAMAAAWLYLTSPDCLQVIHRQAWTFCSISSILSPWQHNTCHCNPFKDSLHNKENSDLLTSFLLIFLVLLEWPNAANGKENERFRGQSYRTMGHLKLEGTIRIIEANSLLFAWLPIHVTQNVIPCEERGMFALECHSRH